MRREAGVQAAAARHRVEAVPAHPEDEGAEDLEGGGLARHRHRLAFLIEATEARLDNNGAAERRDATRHVDHARAGKVEAAPEDGHALVGGEGAR